MTGTGCVEQLRQSQHTRLPVYEGEIDRIIGVLHMKQVVHELARGRLDRDALIEAASAREAYFVPSGTTLNTQLLNFQRDKRRMAFVVDEYGDIQGLVTLEDILEEIVGEFTTDPATMMHKDVHAEADGSFVANASTTIRALNRSMRWNLPTDGPKTLNGLIVEFLETIPEPGTTLKLADYMLEVLQTGDNAIKTVRIRPPDPTPCLRARTPRAPDSGASRRAPSCPRAGASARWPPAPRPSLKPCLAASRRRSSPKGTGRISPASPSSPKAIRELGTGVSRRLERAAITMARSPAVSAKRTPPTTLANTSWPLQLQAGMAMGHRQQHGEAIAVDAHRHPARIGAEARIRQHLHFDQQRARALAHHGDDAARNRLGVARQENRRRVGHLAQALLDHGEHADLVGGAEAILHRAQHADSGCRCRSRSTAPCRPCARARAARRSALPW